MTIPHRQRGREAWILLAAAAAALACGGGVVHGGEEVDVATPSFSPPPGAVAAGTTIAVHSTTAGATIYADQTNPPATAAATFTVGAAGTWYAQARLDGHSSAVASAAYTIASSGGSLALITTTCPAATQGQPYTCTLAASGGTPPYRFSVVSSASYAPLPEGLALNVTTGVVSSARVGGQGEYGVRVQVADAASHTAARDLFFRVAGSNAFLASIFPASSIFHHRVDFATTSLPVDASPAAPIFGAYRSAALRVFFGSASYLNLPNGIPAVTVPWDQANVPVQTTVYQSYFTSGPLPSYAPVEGTAASADGDRHVLVYRAAGGGHPPALYELWQGSYLGASGWTTSSNALWSDVTSNALTPQDEGTADAAGLPIAPLLLNADEVIGAGTPAAPSGAVRHPVRFTTQHMLNYWVWPGTSTAGTGSCTAAGGAAVAVRTRLSQSAPPAACTGMSGPAGQIYRLKASVPTPACAATSPQAAIVITGFRDYGIILSDNGLSGGLIGTPDSRWDDDDLFCLTHLTLNDFEPVDVSSLMVSQDSGATAR